MKLRSPLFTVLIALCFSACSTKKEEEPAPQPVVQEPITPEPAINGTFSGTIVKYYRSDYQTTSFSEQRQLTTSLNTAGVLTIQASEFHLTDSTFTEKQALSTPQYQHFENKPDPSRGKKLIIVKYSPTNDSLVARCTIDAGTTYQFYAFFGKKN